jgi:ketopantoate reductase
MSTMRIAVAGTGGLACLIAHFISEETTHGVVLLSRAVSYWTLIALCNKLVAIHFRRY